MSIHATDVDHKALSGLVYLDIKGTKLWPIYENQGKQITVQDLINYHIEAGNIKETERANYAKYANWKITNVVANNSKDQSGFVGYTFEPTGTQRQAIVAFRGSEPMLNDWQNNFTSVYAELTRQQHEAKAYMEKYMKDYNQITVTGHSLGGNLALAVTVITNESVRSKIINCTTFNAPGFNSEFLETYREQVQQASHKIKEFQNKYDLVSSLLHNLTTPIIISTKSGNENTFDFANHSLDNLSVDSNGELVREKGQTKSDGGHLISFITQEVDKLPNPYLKNLVTDVFSIINDRTKIAEVVVIAGTLLVTTPASILIPAVVTLAAIVFIIYNIDKIVPFIRNAVEKTSELIKAAYDVTVNAIKEVFDQIHKMGMDILGKFNDLKQMVYEEVHNFFNRISKAIKDAWGYWNKAMQPENIYVNIADLRNLASRLQQVQNKLVNVDRRLDRLTDLVEFEKKINVIWIDYKVGYSQDLNRCIDYINNAAEELELCERKIMQKALAF